MSNTSNTPNIFQRTGKWITNTWNSACDKVNSYAEAHPQATAIVMIGTVALVASAGATVGSRIGNTVFTSKAS